MREVGGRKVIVFAQQQDEDTTVATIVIRASTEHVLNDVEVSILCPVFIRHSMSLLRMIRRTIPLLIPIRHTTLILMASLMSPSLLQQSS